MLKNATAHQAALLKKRRGQIEFALQGSETPEAALMIERGEGSFSGCVSILKMFHQANADIAWFEEKNLIKCRYHSTVATRLFYISLESDSAGGILSEPEWYYPFIADDQDFFNWATSFEPESKFFIRRVTNPTQNEFRFYQVTLALKGKLEEVGRRAEFFLNSPPLKMKKYIPDMEFYLSLARRDKTGMESAILSLISPKYQKIRNDVFELAIAGEFISPFAFIYVKLARRLGYILDVDSDLIPTEWLEIQAVDEYSDPYPFMKSWKMQSSSEGLPKK